MCLRIPDITLASGGEPTFLLAMANTSQPRFLDYATARKIADENRAGGDGPYAHLQGKTPDVVPDLLALAESQDSLPPMFLVQNQFDHVNPFADHGFRLLDVYNRKNGWYGLRVYPAIGHGGDGAQDEAELFFRHVLDKGLPRRALLPV